MVQMLSFLESSMSIAKLIYLSHTRSDIAYAISVVCQSMNDPNKRQVQAVDKFFNTWRQAKERDYSS